MVKLHMCIRIGMYVSIFILNIPNFSNCSMHIILYCYLSTCFSICDMLVKFGPRHNAVITDANMDNILVHYQEGYEIAIASSPLLAESITFNCQYFDFLLLHNFKDRAAILLTAAVDATKITLGNDIQNWRNTHPKLGMLLARRRHVIALP